MENHREPEVRVDMDIADFSSKTVKRIDIENVVGRTDPHKRGIAIVMSFVDGATATILVSSGQLPVVATPYARPRMTDYSIIDDEDAVQRP
jgi:hypothetical protein